MKPLHQFNDYDRAHLLHQLFPEQIPALIEFIEGMCAAIKEDEERNRQSWDNDFITFDFWLELIEQTESVMTINRTKLKTDSKLFGKRLFEGYIAHFTTHCITIYIKVMQHTDQKFVKAADLLFNP